MHQFKRWVIFVAAIFLAIAATLVGTDHLYYMAALLLSLPIISYVLGALSLRDLTFAREVPTSGWQGETVAFGIVTRSASRLPRLLLEAEERLPSGLHREEQPVVFNAPPMSATKVEYPVELERRGAYKIEGLRVAAEDPLGIFSFSRTYPADAEILVYPVPQRIPDHAFSGSERFGFRDMPVATTRGSGVDPDGVREYVPGDPLRRMHWKSTARTGRLNVIEFEESRSLNVTMVVDNHQGSDVGAGRQSTLEYLVLAAASLAQQAVQQGASIRLVWGDDPDPADAAGRGTEHLYSVLASLARVAATEPKPLSERLTARVGHLPPGTTLVLLTADTDPGLAAAVANYTISGARAVVYYADPRSFKQNLRSPTVEAQRAFLEELNAVGAQTVLLRRTEDLLLRPEPITDVRQFAEL
jgi:uncharacterized protein (DUF58 family)